MEWVMYTAAGLISGAPWPMSIPDAIRAAGGRRMLIIAADSVADEPVAARWFWTASPCSAATAASSLAMRASRAASSAGVAQAQPAARALTLAPAASATSRRCCEAMMSPPNPCWRRPCPYIPT